MTTQVAETILAQLGSHRFIAMTGAKNFVGGNDTLSFQLPVSSTKQRATGMRIILGATDTYEVQLVKFNRKKLVLDVLDSADGVYADNLQSVFTRMTGLVTHI